MMQEIESTKMARENWLDIHDMRDDIFACKLLIGNIIKRMPKEQREDMIKYIKRSQTAKLKSVLIPARL